MRSVKPFLFLLITFLPSLASALGLTELIEGALNYHPSIIQQKELQSASLKGLDSAKWQYFPTPSISLDAVSTSDKDQSYSGDDYAIRLGLNQPLYTGGRISAGVAAAEANIVAANAGLAQSAEDVSLQMVQSYGDWLSAHLKGLAWAKSIATHEKLKNQVKRRTEAGIATLSDLSLAKGRLESNHADAATVFAEEAVSITHLEELFGHVIKIKELRSSKPFPIELAADIVALENAALINNPAMLTARATVLNAEADVKLQKTSLKPDVSLRLEHQHGNTSYDSARDSENRLFLIAGSRFGAGLSSFSAIDQSLIRKNAALAQLNSTRVRLRRIVQSDYALLQSFQVRINALEASLQTAIEVSESYSRQFLVGRKSWLDVMNAARDLVGIEVQLADAKSAEVFVSWRLSIIALGLDATLAEVAKSQQLSASDTTFDLSGNNNNE